MKKLVGRLSERLCALLLASLLFTAIGSNNSAAANSDEVQGGYATEPLSKPIFDPAKLLVETVGIVNWLGQRVLEIDKWTFEQRKGPREYLYYLIDSRAKHLFAEHGVIMPAGHDPILEMLTSWAEKLDVYGGNLIYNAVKTPDRPTRSPTPLPVPGIDISLHEDMLELESESGGYSFRVPYYFMIHFIYDGDSAYGPIQTVALSTGATTHEGQEGFSQASLQIMLDHEDSDPNLGSVFMERHYGFTGNEDVTILPVRSLESRHRYDKDRNLHVEYTSWPTEKGEILVTYSGIAGTYEWNRPHFIDFLRNLKTQPK